LIDDLLQPTGISVKPNETQLKELSRRAKNLDREIIFKLLMEKLNNYENMAEGNNLKILTVYSKIILESSLCCRKFDSKRVE
jgi:hypothetical protein